MYFDTLELENFGPFSKYKVSFSPNGINLITGANGSGKTQLVGGIIFSLLGRKVIDIVPNGKIPSEVSLSICDGQQVENIKSHYSGGNKRTVQITRKTSQPNSHDFTMSDYLRLMLQGRDSAQLLLSDNQRLDISLSTDELSIIEKLQPNNKEILDFLDGLEQNMSSGKVAGQYLSESTRKIVVFLKEFVLRQSVNFSTPLILDSFFTYFDLHGLKMVWNLIELLSNRDQIIFLANSESNLYTQSKNVKSHNKLEFSPSKEISSLSYNYFPRQSIRKPKIRATSKNQFIQGQSFQVDENRYYEFKEVKGDNPLRSIISVVDEYAVAFLNMGRKGVGRIYWGISNSKVIVGVKLESAERDELRRLVTEKLHQIEPPVAPSGYEIILHQVFSTDEINRNLFLVEVKVPSSQSDLLYSTGKGEVCIKTDAGKKKLSAQELQREILRRHNIQ